ncbi:SCO family protein [Haloferula sp. BvORR071]|uniref:SCO family protein n=1 Tax=Haloferula sp. BvORR071 TaxID=1396141 RepID=UPI00069659C0|nr:SCO family protein [Haloferula sp. BvORR071]
MNDRGKIAMIYGSVAVISAAFIGGMIYLGKQVPEQPVPNFTEVGTPKEMQFFQIKNDLSGVNQTGKEVKLSDLKGKVWVVTEFLAVCPHCGIRNGKDLSEIYHAFKDHPDFHMVNISVDPKNDTREVFQDYGKVLGADPEKWWFMSHPDEKETHDYLEKQLGFMGVRLRKDPVDQQVNGRFAHDMGIMLVDREWNVIGKWPLYDAASDEGRKQDPELYERLKKDMMDRIKAELEKNETAHTDADTVQQEAAGAPVAGDNR